MYKSNTELIVIDAKATEPIPTNVVFWSHDKGTAKMLFQLQKDYVNQTLSEGTIVPICLDFVGGRHIYHAVIEDAVNGIVSIVLEDNILGYQGRVDGSIYIELPDSRSLDTAGRFTFHIKRSPIDEDVPELENYYWQGFSDIMEQYHESIAEIKLEAKTTLDSLTADVTTVQNELTNLNTRIDEINKKIDDNDVFTKAESSANVINQISGTDTVQITYSLDLMSKISGSNIENVNSFKYISVKNGIIPSVATATELSNSGNWDDYARVSKLDNSVFNTTTTTKNESPGQIAFWNILGYLKKELSENFFLNAGAKTVTQQSELVRKLVTGNTKISRWGYGVSPAGGGLTAQLFNTSTSTWDNSISHSISTVSRLTHVIDEADISKYINNEGILMQISFCNTSDGVTTSRTVTDYANIEFTIELSANDYINYMIAQNHVTNLATQAEATTATDNTKTMTPLRTKQLLDAKLLNMVYPIGSIYMSVNSATPATLFGGTWERFSKGRVLVGVDESDTVLATSGKQGGSTNPLTTHTHTTQLTTYRVTSAGSGAVNNLARSTDQGNAATGEFGATSSAGDNTDHNNWQPFTTVYMWKRTA